VTAAATGLSQRGSSFALASTLLPMATARRVARLYELCRTVDDLADRHASPAATARLARIRAELAAAAPRDPVVRELRELSREGGFPLGYARDLVKGVQGDLDPVRVDEVGDLLVYAYRVAGTVGAMMAPMLGAEDERAVGPAVDLGIAMQLTNIARDVLEDARADRRYLPAAWVDLPPGAIAAATPAARERVPAALHELLALADRYYERGATGLPYLPLRARATVAVAAELYRAIGTVVRERDGAYWRGRAVVARPRRWALAARALVRAGGDGAAPLAATTT
jgi:phytoene synthase